MTQRVRRSLTSAIVFALAGALAMTGLVWISVWATNELRAYVGGWAPLLVGVILFVPLIVIAAARALRASPSTPAPSASQGVSFMSRPRLSGEHVDIAEAAKAFVQRSPLTALALGAVAGLVLSRSSGVLSRLLDALDEAPRR